MGNETNAMLALKNAWTGAIAASDRLRELAPVVQGLPDDADGGQHSDADSLGLEQCAAAPDLSFDLRFALQPWRYR